MADRRRRSPEGSRKGSKRESRKDSRGAASEYYNPPPSGPQMRPPSPVRYSSSSSSSSSYLDISRTFPTHRSGLIAFFTAPSERRRLRKRRSKKLLRLNNSSSSSVNSDLAYGTGFVKRKKQRGVRSKHGKGIDRESERERERYRERESQTQRPGSGSGRRLTTDAEILAVGAGLAKLARDQNKLDLKAAKNGKRPDLGPPRESGNSSYGASRGLGHSKVGPGKGSFDDDGWESASDGESDSSVNSNLAFTNESTVSFWPFGKKKQKPQSRKSTVVDPRLFGRQNSLNGILTEPVGMHGDVTWTSTTNFGPQNFIPHEPGAGSFIGASATASQTSLRQVYPVATDDPYRVDAARGRNGSSVVSGPDVYSSSSRPEPVPLQHPKPFTPVSQSVLYDTPSYTARSESGSILKDKPSSSGKGKSIAEAALVGVAGAAIASAISDRKDDRKDKRREEEREQERMKRREYEQDEERRRRRDSERKESKDERRRDRRDSPDRSERKDKSKEKEREREKEKEKEKRKSDSKYPVEDSRHEKRKDETREEKEKRREKRREDRRSEAGDDRNESRRTKSESSVVQTSVDPFQYQVERDQYNSTQTAVPAPEHRRVGSVPTVVTVEREPDFGRQRSSSIKEGPSNYGSDPRSYPEYDDYRRKSDDPRDRPLEDGERNYQEIVHSTAPYSEAAIGAGVIAVAAEGYRESRSSKRRNERRGEDYEDRDDIARDKDRSTYEDSTNSRRSSAKDRDSPKERDPIQEEADRAYREIVMARKIASQVIRSRTPSPDRSVVDKYSHQEADEEIIRIVTPPEMKESIRQKGPYDAPNADFRPDYVLTNPRELEYFRIPAPDLDRSNAHSGYLKRDPDADRPRPHLNLVHPTPIPSPIPEKQATRSEPKQSSEKTREPKQSAAPDVVNEPRGDVVTSPTASNISKGVTWGENETKHFEVESPHEHKDEFVTKDEVKQHVDRDQPKSPGTTSKGVGWGAVAAAIGAGAGAAAGASTESSRSAKSTEKDEQQSKPYEYRGVVVEPENTSRSTRQPSPPSPGPKPIAKSTDQSYTSASKTQASHVPGAFDDDLDFTAHVAAGLRDTGFDPNIVINDPAFRRRDSPPGSNEPGFYRAPFAETVTDLGSVAPGSKGEQSFVIGDVDQTPQEWRSDLHEDDGSASRLSKKEQKKRDKAAAKQSFDDLESKETSAREIVEEPDEWFDAPKLSKKEQKKRDKAARQVSLTEEVTPPISTSDTPQFVEEPESYFETPKKSKKKSKKSGFSYEEEAEDSARNVAVSVHAFDDLQNGQDDWAEPKDSKKSKKKSKRDSELYESPSQSAAPSEVGTELERSSSKKSKDKSKRRSEGFEPNPSEVSLPPSTPSETSRDGEFSELRSSRRSNRDSGIVPSLDRDDSRSIVSSRYDDDEPRKKKKSKSSTKDDFDDTRSVASAPVGDDEDRKQKKDKKSGSFFGLFGSKSDVGAREESPKASKDDFEDVKKKSKKEKRRSIPDADGFYGNPSSQSSNDLSRTVSNGQSNGSHHFDDGPDPDAKSDGEKKKSRSRAESTSSKKDSFLGNAGTLGAGVGIAGAAVAIAAQHHQQSKAAKENSSEAIEHEDVSRSERSAELENVFDPEIIPRQIRPSIDPQYGDLLPLPPSVPTSPSLESLADLPDLPDSRPGSPEAGRPSRLTPTPLRRNLIETPMKSPSHSAVPLKFMMGNRSTPSSPGLIRSPQGQSPENQQHETLSFPRSRPARPTSWDSTKEYKPLYLVESNRRLSNARVEDREENLPELPPSQGTSRSSSQHEHRSSEERFAPTFSDDSKSPNLPLSIDTALASSHSGELLDSQQSTPRAGIALREVLDSSAPQQEPSEFRSSPPLPAHRVIEPPSPTIMEKSRTIDDLAPTAAVAAGLVSTIGYFASSPRRPTVKENWMDDLPSVQQRPSPINSMTKDRSSYLLNSSPMYRKFDSDDVATRDLPSPTLKANVPSSVGDTLHSIEERDGGDIFSVRSTEQGMDLEPAASASKFEDEGPEEFSSSKSKKDKKKDKKKSKGLSRSSTQDDVSDFIPGHSADLEPSFPTEVVPVEDYDLPKSKKDKKKDKKKNKSALNWEETVDDNDEQPQAQQTTAETSREISEETPAFDTTEEFTSLKSKKEKKKDKKKSMSALIWDEAASEEPLEQQAQSTVPKSAREIASSDSAAFDTDLANESFIPSSKSKKEKKNKKKSQVLADTLLEPEQPILTAEELTADEFHDAPEGYVTPVDSTSLETPFEEFSTPQSNYGASSSKEAFNWEIKEEGSTANKEPAITSWDDLATEAQITPLEADPFLDFSAPKSKKDKKKSKAAQALAFVEDDNLGSSQDAFSAILNLPETSTQLPRSTARDVFEDAMTPTVSKDLQIDENLPPKPASGEEFQVTQFQPEPAVAEKTDAFEADSASEFALPKSKKEKKKKGKSSLAKVADEAKGLQLDPSREETEDSQPSIPPTAAEEEEFFVPKSKKDKKKDKKKAKSFAWEENVPESSPEESVTEPAQDFIEKGSTTFDDSTFTGSSKVEDTEKNPASFGIIEEAVLDLTPNLSEPQQEAMPDSLQDATVEDFGFVESKKGKKKKNKNKSSSLSANDPESLPLCEDQQQDVSEFARSNRDEEITSKARDIEESSRAVDPPKFPFEKPLISADQTLLPVAGIATIAALGTAAIEDDGTKSSMADQENRDGFNAGYNNDQLSLARQLQEEFAAKSSKKSKKDKKNRQSLPSTPDPEGSRSRAAEDIASEQPRARSLSIGPSADRSADSPSTDLRRSLYREDQMELARQLKEEFDGGKKKSKKDKKKPQRISTEEDTYFDLPTGEVPTEEAFVDSPLEGRDLSTAEEPVKRDGFEAGYQQDQLSLARQLQAEFGKKSKKDKKRRSTSQTPLDEEPRNDYFGESSHYIASDPSQVDNTASNVESPAADSGRSRDGLAVGYNEDQLELARQLKDEFASGSKKSKKDKKGKQRESLLRSTTDDDFYSDAGPRVREDQDHFETPPSEIIAESEAVTPNPEDEFAPVSKKSKKDKKSKKRESLLRGNTDDSSSAQPVPTAEEIELEASETTRVDSVDVLGDNPPIEPEDEFAPVTKKSKKDKKGKKRDSTIPSAVEEAVTIETSSPEGEQSKQDDNPDLEVAEFDASTQLLADEGFSLSTKKSKKDKKKNKRDSIIPSTDDNISAEPLLTKQAITQPEIVEAEESSQIEPVMAEPEAEFPLTSKKSKKDKKGKKESSLQLSSDNFGDAVEALHQTPDLGTKEVEIDTADAAPPDDDDWTSFSMSKKSKKDKKKNNQSTVAPVEFVANREIDGLNSIAVPVEAMDNWGSSSMEPKADENKEFLADGSFYEPEPKISPLESAANQEPPTAEVTSAPTAAEEENINADVFEFTTKKLKKDKKKRASLLRSSTFEEDKEQIPEIESSAPISDQLEPNPETADQVPEVVVAEDDDFEVSGKKSKKEKKKRKSIQQAAEFDSSPKDVEPMTVQSESKSRELEIPTSETVISPETIRSEFEPELTADTPEAGFDDFAFTTKKSKKDKKKSKNSKSSSAEQSGPATPPDLVSESKVIPEPISRTVDIVAKDIGSDELTQVTDVPSSHVPRQHDDDLYTAGLKKSEEGKSTMLDEPRTDQLSEPHEKRDDLSALTKAEFPRSGDSDIRESQASTSDIAPELPKEIVQEPEISSLNEATKLPLDPVRELEIPTVDTLPHLAIETAEQPESSAVKATPELSTEPSEDVDDAWGFSSAKKSKKDKKKKKSGQSTPAEDFSIPTSDKTEMIGDSQVPSEASATVELTPEAIVEPDEEWANFSLKKSKKDKKKAKKSGLSTPLNEETDSPFGITVEPTEITTDPASSQAAAPAAIDAVADDDWTASSSTKKSKKEKKKAKSISITPSEDIPVVPEPELAPERPSISSAHDIETSIPDTSLVPTIQPALESQLAPPIVEESSERSLDTSVPFVISDAAPGSQFQSVLSEPETEDKEMGTNIPATMTASITEPVLDTGDEWDTLTRKKSKKDKKGKKSGLSTPFAEVMADTDQFAESEPSSGIRDRETEDMPTIPKVDAAQQPEPEDEWGMFTKTSKKDKKKSKKSGLSTPIGDAPNVATPEDFFDPEPSNEQVEASVIPEAVQQALAEDEWNFPPVKLSKKDKKKNKNSGVLTPVEDSSGAATVERSVDSEQSLDRGFEAPDVQVADAEDEWASGAFSVKKSKKDKKKQRSSGLSTPLDMEIPESNTEQTEENFQASGIPPIAIGDDMSQPQIPNEATKELSKEQKVAVTPIIETAPKSSKKEKKKRKSESSTPVEEPTSVPPQAAISEIDKSDLLPVADQEAEIETQHFESTAPEPEFEFTTKKSKKDKKSKRTSKIEYEDIPSTSASITPIADIAAAAGIDNPLGLERKSTSSALLEHEPWISSEYTLEPESATEPVAAVVKDPNDADDSTFELSRKSSKKDKRKRQPTLDFSAQDDSNSPRPPLTSWADEIEEAEIERQAPVIEEIAEDESLSRIASTTEASAIDDFSRPSKKGKKGKKRQSLEPDFATEPPPPTEDDMKQGGQTSEHSGLSTLGAAGAALVGAGVIGAAKQTSDSNKEKAVTTEVKETPSRKQSKKDKKKKGIDRRSTREDDIFDDPSLWEGAEPKAHEELKDALADDDAGDDGFWSPPQEEQLMDTTPYHPEKLRSLSFENENAPSGLIQHVTPQRSDMDEIKQASTKEHLLARDLEFSRGEHEKNRLPTLMIDEEYTSARNQSPVLPMHVSRDREATVDHDPKKSDLSFSTPTRREQIIIADTPEERSPIRPFGSSKFALSGFSDLPAVEEEGPAQSETENSRQLGHEAPYNRDSAFVSGSPIPAQRALFPDTHEPIRDSGVHLRDVSPLSKSRGAVTSSDDAIARLSWPSVDEDSETVDLDKSQRYASASTKKQSQDRSKHHDAAITSRDHLSSQRPRDEKFTDLHQSQTGHGSPSLVRQRVQRIESPDFQKADKPKSHEFADSGFSRKPKTDKYQELSSSQIPRLDKTRGIDESLPASAGLGAASLGFAAARQSSLEKRPESAQSQRSTSNVNRLRSPDPRYRPDSVASNRSGTPPLRRTDRKISGDLRSLSQLSKPNLAKEAELAAIAASAVNTVNTANPTANEGRVRAKDMADVYDGFGEGRMGSPRSPTRPHSMRRRQSMQVLELESRLESLAAENRMLSEANAQAERGLQSSRHDPSSLVEKDAEIDALKRTLDWLQTEVTRLTEVNDGLTSANVTLGNQHNQAFGALESQHAQATRELDEVRESHNTLTTGMQGIVAAQIQNATEEKDREIAQLRASLDAAKEQIRQMQRQILASKANDSDFLTIRDEDYFDTACQNLCQHVQQWVLRFSKFSDMRACRLTSEINNDKTIDRLDNAILDGSDVDTYLADRIKRRDVFMSMTMTMVWEFVFTRYLFGMDREQRQKLKSLEKLLSEVGPASAVHQWRATTLTLLAKREAFIQQRQQDTQAVVHAIMETLSEILPPPSQLEGQIEEQLERVMKAAVDLSIEMRTQRAEYMMLPPLQPEYDANGDLASKVQFNAALMNERSGDTVSNEDLEAQKAVVRIVLFPLVVKKGDDKGEGDEEIVVCPAQVLVAKSKKQVRVFSPGSAAAASRVSMQSNMPADYGEGSAI